MNLSGSDITNDVTEAETEAFRNIELKQETTTLSGIRINVPTTSLVFSMPADLHDFYTGLSIKLGKGPDGLSDLLVSVLQDYRRQVDI